MPKRLEGQVAVVTGASRGAGRGIALVLGGEGATVYVTGRSTRVHMTRPDLSGTTVEDTAEMVSARGGEGIAVPCDHTDDSQVQMLFGRVEADQGRLDLLVNNVWGGYEDIELGGFEAPFWEQPQWRWDKMFRAGVRAHYVASRLAAPLMIGQRRGLIVSTTFWDQDRVLTPVSYDVAKAAINRMACALAHELESYSVAALAISPGWMRTEAVLAHEHSPEELGRTESVEYIGRAVAALATDPRVMDKSGQTLTAGALACEYGFTDVDGSQPPPFDILGPSD